jgi:hypothetical protein
MSPEQLQQKAQERAEAYHSYWKLGNKPGEHHYEVCHICGEAQWTTTRQSEQSTILGHLSYGSCARCFEIHQRYPELFTWLGGVLSMLQPPDQSSTP